MAKSMTGFGRGEYKDEKRIITAEIKSVNHRYSDISVKMSRRYSFAEERLKAIVKNSIPRGKVELSVYVQPVGESDSEISVNAPLARQYYEAFMQIREAVPELEGDISLRSIASMPDVIRAAAAGDEDEELLEALSKAVETACEGHDSMRSIEGAKLMEDVLYRNDLIEKTVSEIEEYAPKVAEDYFKKMQERISELLPEGAEIPVDRIMLEAAVFADKSNITEEITRLKSHVSQMRQIAAAEGSIGKKLDFLVQEMNRESNTIGSKANDINITNNVLILKAEIEKIREQIQNIE